MIEFYLPGSVGEALAFAVALITIFFGLLLFFMPRLSFRILHLQTFPDRPDAIAEGRGTMAGFILAAGLGASCSPSLCFISCLARPGRLRRLAGQPRLSSTGQQRRSTLCQW